MAGRKPTPTALRTLRGNPGKRAMPKGEPQPRAASSDPPEWLSDRAKEAWGALAPMLSSMRLLTEADGAALSLLVDALAEWRDARDVVKRLGATYESHNALGDLMMIRKRPEVAIAAEARRFAKAMLSEFGLSPSSRSRVSVIEEEEVDPFAEFGG